MIYPHPRDAPASEVRYSSSARRSRIDTSARGCSSAGDHTVNEAERPSRVGDVHTRPGDLMHTQCRHFLIFRQKPELRYTRPSVHACNSDSDDRPVAPGRLSSSRAHSHRLADVYGLPEFALHSQMVTSLTSHSRALRSIDLLSPAKIAPFIGRLRPIVFPRLQKP